MDHSCSGGHTGHPDLCQNKKLGAVACPHQIQPTQIISHQETQRPNQNEFTDECATCEKCEMLDSYFKHLPAFECSCKNCVNFFWGLQTELNMNGINININEAYDNFHFSSYDDAWENNSVTEVSDEDLCTECHIMPAKGWGHEVCEICQAYLE